MLFLGIISWKGASRFNRGWGVFFRWGGEGFIFNWGDSPWGALVLMEGGVFDKNLWIIDGMGVPPPTPCPHTMGNAVIYANLEEVAA